MYSTNHKLFCIISEELIERLNSQGLTSSDYPTNVHADNYRNGTNPLVLRPMRDVESDSGSDDETSELYPPPSPPASPIDNAMYPSTSPTPPNTYPSRQLPQLPSLPNNYKDYSDNCNPRGSSRLHLTPRNHTGYQPSDAYHTTSDCHIYQDIPAANDYPPSDS